MVGEKVFSHESGLHADGVLKDSGNYEGFDPAEVGLSRHMVIGKHSGTHALKDRFGQLGINVDGYDLSFLLSQVRKYSQVYKRPLSDRDLIRLYHDHAKIA